MAIKVTRKMLKRKYSWSATEGDDPKKTRIDARFLNRKEGYEVQLMMQQVVDHCGFTRKADVERVEEAIAAELPGNIRGRKKVFAWLVERLCAPAPVEDKPRPVPVVPVYYSGCGAYSWYSWHYYHYLWASHAQAWAYHAWLRGYRV